MTLVEVHRRTTAPEIWEDTDGSVDIFVCAVGTRGTITGVGEVLKARKPAVRVVAVEPAGAAAHKALNLAARPDAAGKTIVVLLADTGERYVTTALMTRSLT
jgi:cysteine synthase